MTYARIALGLFLALALGACDNLSVMPASSVSSVPANLALEQVSIAPGGKLTLLGKGLTSSMKAVLGTEELPLAFVDSQTVELSVPSDTPFGLTNFEIRYQNTLLFQANVLIGDSNTEVPEVFADASLICSDIVFKNAFGDLKRGLRDCTLIKPCSEDGQQDCITNEVYRSGDTDHLADKVVLGQKVAGIEGTAVGVPVCDRNSTEACVADGVIFKAIAPASLLDSDIKAGVTLAGVVGTFNGKPDECSADGEIACVATTNFPAVDRVATIDPRRNEFSASYTLGGVSGLIPVCSQDGDVSCITSSLFPAVNKAVNLSASRLSQIHTSLTIAGETGTLATCGVDGESNCLIDGVAYRAATISGAAAKIMQGQTLAGVSGTVVPRPATCSNDGETSCVAAVNFPAIDKVNKLSAANLARIDSSLTIAGETGTLSSCSTDGSTTCVALGPSFAAAHITNAAAKILQGQSLAGISGSAPAKPADCNSDGGTGCTTHASYPAVDSSLVSTKVLIGETLGGLLGGLPSRPLDCASDGETSCVTTGGFPAANISGAAAKILSTETAAGVAGSAIGRPGNCLLDGGLDCVTTADFPAINKVLKLTSGNLAKIHNSLTIGGESGTLADCSGDGESSCFALAAFPAAEVSSAAAKILNGQTLAGQLGTAPVRPSDCSVEGEDSCVATSNFPALDKANKLTPSNLLNIHSSISVAGTLGTMPSCESDGQQSCLTSGTYVSALVNGATAAKIPLGDTLAGVIGSANAKPSLCALDGAVGCTSSAAYPAADISGAAAKIALGETVAGVSGLASVRPTDCAGDGATNCVAVTNFPVIEKAAQLTSGNMAKVRVGHSIGGVAGTLASCVNEGDVGCVVLGPTQAAMNSTGAGAKILSGQSVGAVSGLAALRPANCASDNASSCVAVAAYPAVNKATNLNATNLAKIHNSLTFLGSTGTLNTCATDGDPDCLATSSFPSANVSGANAKILQGQTLAGITGTAPAKPNDCSSNNATGCVAVSAFPAVDKVNKIDGNTASFRPTLTLLGTTGTLQNCSSDGDNACVTTSSYVAAAVGGIETKILSGQILAGVTGTALGRNADCTTDGQQSCVAVADFPAALAFGADAKITSGQTLAGIGGTAPQRPNDCNTDAQTSCVATSTFPSIDKVNKLTANAAKISNTLTIAGVAGSLSSCSSDAATACLSSAAYPAMQVSGAAAKILVGSTLGGEAGTAPVRPSDCSGDNGTGCVAVTAFPAVVKSNVTSNKAKILPSLTVAATAGTMPNCSSDAGVNCYTVTAYPAVNASTAAAKILLGSSLGGVAGTAAVRPADCSAGNVTGCTAATAYPSIAKANLTAGVLKSGVTVNGVTGAYPSGTYPLSANTATTDLTSSNFNTRLTTNVSSEWFDSAGARYTVTGMDDFAAQVKSGVSILGNNGSYAPNCSADGQLDCKTVAGYPSAKMSNFSEWDIRYGVTYAGVAGKFHSPGNFASGSAADVYGTRTDKNNDTGTVAGFAPAMYGDIWARDVNTDSNSNGVCDGSEACIYYDRLAKRHWAKVVDNTVLKTWEDAITYCENLSYGGSTDWRLPMEKELMQAKIDGLNTLTAAAKLNHGSYRYWTATTRYTNTDQAIAIALDNGDGGGTAKTSTMRTICVK